MKTGRAMGHVRGTEGRQIEAGIGTVMRKRAALEGRAGKTKDSMNKDSRSKIYKNK